MSNEKTENEQNTGITIREAIDHYAQLPDDTKLELSYLIEDMTDGEFTDFLLAQEQDCKKDMQMGILLEEELVALQSEALAERISCRLNIEFDAVLDLIDKKFTGDTTRQEDIVFEAMCKDFPDLNVFYKKFVKSK